MFTFGYIRCFLESNPLILGYVQLQFKKTVFQSQIEMKQHMKHMGCKQRQDKQPRTQKNEKK
jgi:hypothetical protein